MSIRAVQCQLRAAKTLAIVAVKGKPWWQASMDMQHASIASAAGKQVVQALPHT
jgi:hypothetical protein